MSFFKKISKKVTKVIKKASKLSLNPIDKEIADYTFRYDSLSPSHGYMQHRKQEDREARREADRLNQEQLDLLAAQENAAANALVNLGLENTPDVVAGGTADVLTDTRKRKKANGGASIATSLGVV